MTIKKLIKEEWTITQFLLYTEFYTNFLIKVITFPSLLLLQYNEELK